MTEAEDYVHKIIKDVANITPVCEDLTELVIIHLIILELVAFYVELYNPRKEKLVRLWR